MKERSAKSPSRGGRLLAALFGAVSAILAVVAVPMAVMAPLGLDLQASSGNRALAYVLLLSPLLLLAGAALAFLAWRRPSLPRLGAMLLPSLAVAGALVAMLHSG